MQRARREQKPVMIDVYTTWCSPCKYLDSEIYTQQNVRAQSVYWISVKVDAEARPDIAQSYGVRGFPTLIFASPDGRPLSVEDGVALDPSFSTTVVQWMQDARAKFVPSSN